MNRLTRLVGTVREIKGGWDSVFLKNLPLDEDNVLTKPYKKSDLVYVCITTTARAISQVPLRKYIRDSKDEVLQVASGNDPWQRLLLRPNYLMDQYSFVESLISYLMLDGNVWIVPFPPGAAVPSSLWVVSKRNITPKLDNKGHLASWLYRPKPDSPVGQVILLPHEVCHIWFWNPYDPILGMAPVVAGEISIKTDYKAMRYNQIFFDQGGKPSGVLSTDGKLGPVQFERLKQQTEAEHSGYKKAHRLMVLEQGMKYSQTSLTHKDMEFRELAKLTQERILQIFGMKKSIIAVTEDLNYATAREQRKSWWEDTNLPMMKLTSSAMNFVFFNDDPSVKVMYDLSSIEALQTEFKEKVAIADKLWKMGFTANELNDRLEMGFKPKRHREYWYMPVNVFPVLDEPHHPAMDNDNNQQRGNGKIFKLSASDGTIDIYRGIDYEVKEETVEPAVSVIDKPNRDKLLEGFWKSFISGIESIEKSYENKVRGIFYDMRKKTLTALDRGVKSSGDVDGLNFTKEGERLSRVSGRAYEKAIQAGAKAVSREVGFELLVNAGDPEVMSFIQAKKLKVKGVTDTVKKQLKRTMQEGLQSGETHLQLADRIKQTFNFASNRAKTIARTEIVGASNFGRNQALEKSAFEKFEWFTALDERVRDTHADMHGKTRSKGEPWIVGGASLEYPGDQSGPAKESVNCRCIEVVVPESLRRQAVPEGDIEGIQRRQPRIKNMSRQRVKGFIDECYR